MENDTQVICGQKYVLEKLPKTVKGSDLTQSGFTFGNIPIPLCQNISVKEEGYYRFEAKFNFPSLTIQMGEQSKTLLLQDKAVFYLEKGLNKIYVFATVSNRNLLGPLHNKYNELSILCPESFTNEGGWADVSKDIWSDDYYFVKNGFSLRAVKLKDN